MKLFSIVTLFSSLFFVVNASETTSGLRGNRNLQQPQVTIVSNHQPPARDTNTDNESTSRKPDDNGLRSIVVTINYGENPQDIAWNLNDSGKQIVLLSNFGDVPQSGVVSIRKDGLSTGEYDFIVNNKNGGGTGSIRITDVTNSNGSENGPLIFANSGRFGSFLLKKITIN